MVRFPALKGTGRPSALLAVVLVVIAAPARADMLFGLYAGVGSWQQQPSGELRSGLSSVEIERDLGIEDETNQIGYVAVEHPVPVLPNLRAQFSGINANGNEVLSRTIEVNGTQFAFAETVNSEVRLNQADAVFYYELSDTLLSLDLGVAARYVDGEIELISANQSARAEFSGVLPLLYAATRFDLPLTGLWVGAQAMGIAYQGDRLYDVNAQVGWESSVGIGAEFGWRSFQLTLEDYDELDSADIEVSGPYLALNYHF